MEKKNVAEQRKHKRYKAREDAFAVLNANESKIGQIKDISMGGLSIHYIANGTKSFGSSFLDILLADNGFYMEKVPFESISDFEIPNEFAFSSLKMNRHGVKFGQLTQHQLSQLEDFLRNYTTGNV
jgi:hypothetical protein